MSDEDRTWPAEEDDSLAANPEGPREDTGYRPAPAKPPANDPDRLYFCAERGCRGFKAGALMFQRPRSTGLARETCAGCVGSLNRSHSDAISASVRGLKAAMTLGHAEDERRELHQLTGLVGKHQADATANAIRQARDEKPAKGGRR